MKDNVRTLVGILVAAFLIIGALLLLGNILKEIENEICLPILAIAGVVLLFTTLALVSVTFALFELDDKTQALALPEGSIRAAIALSLIVLFAILAVFLYGSLANGGVSSVSGLTLEQKDSFGGSITKDQVMAVTSPSGNGPFTVYFHNRNPASDDFAKQLLVLVGTLVTSVAGFYFGSKAAASPTSPAPAPPEIRGIEPTRISAGGSSALTINGDRLDLVKEVKIVSGAHQIVATDVVSNASTVRCNFALPPDATGAWDVIVTDGLGRTARLASALTISPPGSPP